MESEDMKLEPKMKKTRASDFTQNQRCILVVVLRKYKHIIDTVKTN